MRLLIDQNLSRRLASLLQIDGHDAVHTEDVGLATAADPLLEKIITERGNALFSLTPAKPIRAEFLPLGPTT